MLQLNAVAMLERKKGARNCVSAPVRDEVSSVGTIALEGPLQLELGLLALLSWRALRSSYACSELR